MLTVEQEISLIHEIGQYLYSELTHRYKEKALLKGLTPLIKLLDNQELPKHFDIPAYKLRGCIAETMLQLVCETWLSHTRTEGFYLGNLLFPTKDNTSQLDGILVTRTFIACIECKSLHGDITINYHAVESEYKQQKPWQQNARHIGALKLNIKPLEFLYIENILYIFSQGKIPKGKLIMPEGCELMVNRNSFITLNRLKQKALFNLSTTELNNIKDNLLKYVPTVKDEIAHIQCLKTLFTE